MKHCKQKLSKVETALDRDNFLTADSAKNWGIIDEIVESRKDTGANDQEDIPG